MCEGHFVSERAEHSQSGFPYAVIREAVIDRRYLSRRHFQRVAGNARSRAFELIILYVTTHLSVSLSRENAVVDVIEFPAPDMREMVADVQANVDYVTHVNPFLFSGAYKPGRKTSQGEEVSEWQVVISLTPRVDVAHAKRTQEAFSHRIRALSDEVTPVKLGITLPLRRYDGKTIEFNANFSIGCATGWEADESYPELEQWDSGKECKAGASGVNGAVVLSGSALYGAKQRDAVHYKEVAHFAARALMGSLRFDAVLMSVVVKNSISDAVQNCGMDEGCMQQMQKENDELLTNLAHGVEAELDAIGMDENLYERVILMPMCRLGSDANGTERGDACRMSHRYGQYHATFFSYAMVSHLFKWAVSYDIDEFLGQAPKSVVGPLGQQRKDLVVGQRRADVVLDGENVFGGGYMYFSWLNFLSDGNMSRSLTKQVMQGRAPLLMHKDGESGHDCYAFTRDPTGKSAARCDVGLGFTIHRPVIIKTGGNHEILGQTQGQVRRRGLRAWHPRLGGSRGQCAFDARADV